MNQITRTIDNITTIGNQMNFCDTHNDQGIKFRFTIVKTGDKYGRNNCLTNDGDHMVEVWDMTPRCTQMVSRYYISTLLGFSQFSNRNCWNYGLCLDGGVPAWRIPAQQLTHVHHWLLQIAHTLNITKEAQ